jgi:hypothetical protein
MATVAEPVDSRHLSKGRVDVLPAPRRTSRTGVAAPWTVCLTAVVLCLLAILWSALTNSLTLYGDARAHLDIARRLTDGLTPGFAQLGSVWLPLPHLLMAPFTAIDVLWHSAAAGAIVGAVSFLYSAVRVFGLAEELLNSRLAAWCAFLVYAFNLDLLYIQTTALTEPVLLALFVGAAYHLTRWTRTGAYRELLMAALMILGATMTRYEGWALLLVGLVIVAVWTRRHQPDAYRVQANVILFFSVAVYGIALWFLYNLIIFHDPLEFIHSSFSSGSQQASLAASGALLTKGSLPTSALTYAWAVVDIAGRATVVLGLLGIAAALTVQRHRHRLFAVLALLGAPAVFNVISLWLGQSTLRVPQVAPFGMWNDRYALMALPLLALGVGMLVRRWRALAPGVLLVVAVSAALAARGTPITVADGRYGLSGAAAAQTAHAATTLAHEYRGGEILADDSSASGIMFASGLNLKQFVTVGFHPYYEEAMANPAGEVHWVLAFDGDAISDAIGQHPDRFAAFHLVVREGRARLYTLPAGVSKASHSK